MSEEIWLIHIARSFDMDDTIQVDESTICQCTGLKAKNGKLIWENDIVRRRSQAQNKYNHAGVVKYGQFNCTCCEGVYGYYIEGGDIRDVGISEVLGNAFDDSELLEVWPRKSIR